MVDAQGSATESTTPTTNEDNVIQITTARVALRLPVVVALDAYADDVRGQFVEGNDVIVSILVESTTDILEGDLLKPVDQQAYLVKATPGTDLYVARAREGRTANDTGLISCLLFSNPRF